MPLTLNEVKVGLRDKIAQGVVDEFIRESFILEALTFDDCVSPGGGSTMTYGYQQLLTPTVANGRAINADYTPGKALRVEKTSKVKIYGGSFEIDRVLSKAKEDEVAFQIEELVKATKNKFHYDFINGDSAVVPEEFDGLDKLLTGTALEKTVSIDISDMSKITANGKEVAFELNGLISKMAEKPDMLLMNSTMYNALCMIAFNMGYRTESEDAFGRKVLNFNGIPMRDMGEYFDGSVMKECVPTDTVAGTTDIYAIKLNMGAVHGISIDGSDMIQVIMPDFSTAGAVKKGEVELLAGIVLKNTKKACVLRGIKVA